MDVRPGQMKLRKFLAPEFVFGIGAFDLVGQCAGNLRMHRPLLVTDPGVDAAGWTGKAASLLKGSGFERRIFSDVTPNPRLTEVMNGAEHFAHENCDGIVAVGGGSVLDCAKGIGIIASNGGDIADYEGVDRVDEPMPPMLCVPTTGGTSADVSQFAILSDEPAKRKLAVISKAVVPDLSLIDPRTLTTLSDHLTACTGLDVLAHAFEALASTGSSPLTDMHARESLSLLWNHLPQSLDQPDNLHHREQVMHASLLAGLAFSNASLGAVHAMAHSLGGLLDLPHGECNALLLEHIVDFNFADAEAAYRSSAVILGLPESRAGAVELSASLKHSVRQFRCAVGVGAGLAARGVSHAQISGLAANALVDPCIVTNPRRPKEGEIEALYEQAL